MTETRAKPAEGQRSRRSAARLAAVQALYQAEMTGGGGTAIASEFVKHRLGHEIDGDRYAPADETLFRALAEGALAQERALDERIAAVLTPDWPIERLDSVLRAILRTATYELVAHEEVPVRVVIAEYVDLGQAFFDGKETGLINGVLERLGREIRPLEWT